MPPLVKLSSFHNLFDKCNLQLLETPDPWERVSCELSYRIALEIPRIENMLNNEKPLISFSNKINHLYSLLSVSLKTPQSFDSWS